MGIRLAPVVGIVALFTGAYFAVDAMGFAGTFPYAMGPFYAMVLGSLVGLFIGLATEYFTAGEFSPVAKVAQAGKTGPATNIIAGLAVGMYSCVLNSFNLFRYLPC